MVNIRLIPFGRGGGARWRLSRSAARAAGIAAGVVFLIVGRPAPSAAWGFEAHKFIMDRAIALLPADLRPIFERHRAVAVERAIDPDTWIIVGGFDEEQPRHFLDLDNYGAYPFKELPRDYAAAVKKYGEARVKRDGTVPWRAQEFADRLRTSFATMRRRGDASAELDAVRIASALCHYISDAHVPFHAVSDYDGRKTKQDGIHARFESVLFQRFAPTLTIAPVAVAPVRDVRTAVFAALLDSSKAVPTVLQADLVAAGARKDYNDAYYTAFLRGARRVLEQRLSQSIVMVAAAIAGASQ